MNLKELKIERDKLREEVSGKSVSVWKFWQYKKDAKLIRDMQRICDINNILKGSRMQKSELNDKSDKSGD